ncbi:hypothetical protein EDB86DRAFT_3072942 [Lactarius hatsudake]|nr:hypothetical protein EDB86DRAFT_3072942 [Lactarius hatsudake]
MRMRDVTGRACTVIITRYPAPLITPTEGNEEEGDDADLRMIDREEHRPRHEDEKEDDDFTLQSRPSSKLVGRSLTKLNIQFLEPLLQHRLRVQIGNTRTEIILVACTSITRTKVVEVFPTIWEGGSP